MGVRRVASMCQGSGRWSPLTLLPMTGEGIKGIMSARVHAQESPVEINLHTTRFGTFTFPPLQKLSKMLQQTACVITKDRL